MDDQPSNPEPRRLDGGADNAVAAAGKKPDDPAGRSGSELLPPPPRTVRSTLAARIARAVGLALELAFIAVAANYWRVTLRHDRLAAAGVRTTGSIVSIEKREPEHAVVEFAWTVDGAEYRASGRVPDKYVFDERRVPGRFTEVIPHHSAEVGSPVQLVYLPDAPSVCALADEVKTKAEHAWSVAIGGTLLFVVGGAVVIAIGEVRRRRMRRLATFGTAVAAEVTAAVKKEAYLFKVTYRFPGPAGADMEGTAVLSDEFRPGDRLPVLFDPDRPARHQPLAIVRQNWKIETAKLTLPAAAGS